MAAEDHIPHEEEDDTGHRGQNKHCRHCGKGGLHWEELENGWALFDDNYRRHKCDMKRVADDFEDLTK